MSVTAGVDSYVTNAEADAYHAAHGHGDWPAASQAARDAALRDATAWLDGTHRWVGDIADVAQTLGWPRIGAHDREGRRLAGVPTKVKDACCEMALAALSGDLAPPEPRGGRVVSESVGGLSVAYAADAPGGTRYPLVDLLLAGLHRGGGGVVVSRG